jgi:copper chaperone CopZ
MRLVDSGIKVLAVAGLFIGLVACNQGPDQVRTVFSVEGMHCDACSTSIVTSLEKVDGVEGAVADHETGIAEAAYRPSAVDVETLKSEIEKLGYTVIGMETEAVEG